MKKVVYAILGATMLCGTLCTAKCLNAAHPKKVASCSIKAKEKEVFDADGFCKFCGCSVMDHDNESK